MKFLVTGATGHLGANLVRRLLADGHAVRVLLRQGSPTRAVDGLDVERAIGDLRDLGAMKAAVRGVDRVFHTAAQISTIAGNEREIYDSNVVGTRNILRAAREEGVGRVVVTGSFSAVGHTDDRPSNETDAFYPFEEHLPYERSKAWVEHEVLKAVAEGQDVLIAISCALLGPNDFKPSRMGGVVRDFANGKLLAYIPGGFEFVATRDVVQGHVLAMEKGRTGQRYIFGTRHLEMDELVEILERITGRPRPRLRLSPAVMLPIAHVAGFVMSNLFPQVQQKLTPGAVRLLGLRRRADKSKAQNELGYRPTSLEDALREAYQWFVEHGEIAPGRARAPETRPAAATQSASAVS